jgi:hypothetical protein
MPQTKKQKRKKWEGPLGEPIQRPTEEFARWFCQNRPGLAPLQWIDELVEFERQAKLHLLLKNYGIRGQTGRDFMELAKRLAVDFVPGFKLAEEAPKPVGAPGKWTTASGTQLVEEVEAVMEGCGLKVGQAIEWIQKIDPARYGNMKKSSLRKRYEEARKRLGRR